MSKIVNIDEWLSWVLKKNPAQKQFTTIKSYWNCVTTEDYIRAFKSDCNRERDLSLKSLDKDFVDTAWCDSLRYTWALDRLFDIRQFVPNCPQLSKVDIGYWVFCDMFSAEEWKDYVQILKTYNKPVYCGRYGVADSTVRIAKIDFGEFQVYCRQSREVCNDVARYVQMHSDENKPMAQNEYVRWYDDQTIFMTAKSIRINKHCNGVKLQSKKRIYVFSDGKAWSSITQNFRLPCLQYPENIKDFIKWCCKQKLINLSPSNISLWVKTDTDCVWHPESSWTKEEFVEMYPFPVENIKTEEELDAYIEKRKEEKALEISTGREYQIYDKNCLFYPLTTITQDHCDQFISECNKNVGSRYTIEK